MSLITAACFYCDWLDWLRIIILANISIEKVRHFIFLSWSGPGVKSRTLTWNTKGSFTSSALSKTNLSGYWEITQTHKAYKFWSTVIGHHLFPFPPLPAPGKLLGDTFQLLCQHTFIYEKKDKTYPASEGYIFVVLAGVRKVVTFARQLRRRENVASARRVA